LWDLSVTNPPSKVHINSFLTSFYFVTASLKNNSKIQLPILNGMTSYLTREFDFIYNKTSRTLFHYILFFLVGIHFISFFSQPDCWPIRNGSFFSLTRFANASILAIQNGSTCIWKVPKELLIDLRDLCSSLQHTSQSHHQIKPRRCGDDGENEVKNHERCRCPLCVPFQHQPDFWIFSPPNTLHTQFFSSV